MEVARRGTGTVLNKLDRHIRTPLCSQVPRDSRMQLPEGVVTTSQHDRDINRMPLLRSGTCTEVRPEPLDLSQ
jgi:hypothetical protein